jgi:hypothetical protein
MNVSEARRLANQKNAQHTTGPKTPEGKAASSANALKHGLTSSKLMTEREAAEFKRRTESFAQELRPRGEVGMTLVERAVMHSIRMERCVEYENAVLIERVQKALTDFQVPDGVTDPAEIARLMREAQRLTLFDPSKEADRARRYEQAAERGFFKALKELRIHERVAEVAEEAALDAITENILGSFSRKDDRASEVAEEPIPTAINDDTLGSFSRKAERAARVEAIIQSVNPQGRPLPPNPADWSAFLADNGRADVPIAIGRSG